MKTRNSFPLLITAIAVSTVVGTSHKVLSETEIRGAFAQSPVLIACGGGGDGGGDGLTPRERKEKEKAEQAELMRMVKARKTKKAQEAVKKMDAGKKLTSEEKKLIKWFKENNVSTKD